MLDDLLERIVRLHAAGPLHGVLRGWEHDGRDGFVILVNGDDAKQQRAEQLFHALGDGPWRIKWTSEPEAEESQTGDDDQEQSVYVEIAVSTVPDAELIWDLVSRLQAELQKQALGELDGAWENGSALAFTLHGVDADALFASALPFLEGLSLRPIQGERRYGPLDDDDEEARTERFSIF